MATPGRKRELSVSLGVSLALHAALLAVFAWPPRVTRVEVEVVTRPPPVAPPPLSSPPARDEVAPGPVASSAVKRQSRDMPRGAFAEGSPCDPADPKLDVMLVLDYSCSMSGRPMEELKSASKRLLDQLEGRARVGTVLFSSGIDGKYGLSLDGTRDVAPLKELVDNHDANGGTNTADALREAGRELTLGAMTRPGHERYVVLVSDGQANDQAAALAAADALRRDGVTIVTLGIGYAGAAALAGLSSGGLEHKAFDVSMLRNIFSLVLLELCAPRLRQHGAVGAHRRQR